MGAILKADNMLNASKLVVRGKVQGVGFRPAVYRVAATMRLNGWVKNTADGVEILINTESSQDFLTNLKKALPPLARIDSINEELIELNFTPDKFVIEPHDLSCYHEENASQLKQSLATANNTGVLPDSGICQECLGDIFNPKSKYYLYPFTSCSNCGPRYTIIKNAPYSRANTAMSAFPLCANCGAEFKNPLNRRYYAETMCCSNCGPHLDLALADVAKRIANGEIVALKTTGGYVLIANANNAKTIRRLRQNKQRPNKPLALMALNTQSIKEYYCNVNIHEQKLLESHIAPIVIMDAKCCNRKNKNVPDIMHPEKYLANSNAIDYIAHGLNTLAFMLPSSPIYYLLFYYLFDSPEGNAWLKQAHNHTLIVTSANLSGGSIISDDAIAKKELTKIADIIVGYNREIVMKCDDSVVLPMANSDVIIRSGRGLAPMEYRFDYKLPQVLGLGAHLKNTICFTRGDKAYLSQYLGDMDSQHTIKYFHNVLKHYQQIFNFTPELIVSDLHPDFYTSIYAGEYGLPHLQLQHHYAHMAAALGAAQASGQELQPNVLGCIFDGYGYGDDGRAWGGELIGFNREELKFTRISHLPSIIMPGGDSAKREPWKIALAWCLEHNLVVPKHISHMPDADLVTTLIQQEYTMWTSSAGQLFSLVSSLLGICCYNTYEAEAVLRLESLFTNPELELDYVHLTKDAKPDIHLLLKRIYHLANNEGNVTRAVNVFYTNLAALCEKWIVYHASLTGITQVVISGGCWQSRHLLPMFLEKLQSTNIKVLLPKEWVVFNDESISLGQAWYGAQHLLSERNLCV